VTRRRRVLVVGAVVVVAAVPVALLWPRGADAKDPAASDSTKSTTAATVTTRDMSDHIDVDGTLGYGSSHAIALSAGGTITALPTVGTVVDRGQQIAEVDGKPVVLLLGDRPLWRALAEGVTDGPDVEELEANLIALGYATEGQLGPDQTWTAETTTAVKKWQKALGLEETGAVQPGAVVVSGGPLRVAELTAEIGSPANGPAMKVTGTTQLVTADLDAKRQSLVKAGDKVQVTLPDNRTVPGTVFSVGSVATTAQQGADPTVPMVVVLDQGTTGSALDQAPVTVGITTTTATHVLAVPVEALLALAEGGYAVERTDGTLVPVTTGAFANGWVQISGDVNEGDTVVAAQ
jgi:peptidoglycan hydrolase-like protein with peptidoglycan-binding domain